MAVTIRLADTDGASESRTFGDEVDYIVIGRDPSRCHVVFPPEARTVGREHCAVRRVLGRYRLCLNGANPVLVDGTPAADEAELPQTAELQLGHSGPRLIVETVINPSLAATVRGSTPRRERGGAPRHVPDTRQSRTRFSNRVVQMLVLGLIAAGTGLFVTVNRQRRAIELRGETDRQQAEARRLREEQARELASLRAEALGQLEAQKEALAALKQTTLAELGRVEGRLSAREDDGTEADQKGRGPKRAEAGEERLRQALMTARSSVYMVVLQFERNGGVIEEDGHGTAWVVADGILATNAHVAKVFDDVGSEVPDLENYGSLRRVVVRSGGASPRSHRVAAAEIHPGFTAFEKVWRAYRPAQGHSRETLRSIESPGNACDVALLHVADDERDGLGPPLQIADPAAIRRLDAGDLVGFLGYPMENMALVNPRFPSPQAQIGRVTGVTDYFGISRRDAAGFCTGHLVQHGLPVTGGASGSPILDRHGDVVAVLSGGNMVAVQSGRISVGFNFAQRIDLVRELLGEDTEQRQRARTAAWRAELPRIFESGTAPMRRELPTGIIDDCQRDRAPRLEPQRVFDFSGILDGDPRATWSAQTKPLPPGKYLAFAIAESADDIGLRVEAPSGRKGQPFASHRTGMGWVQAATLELERVGEIRLPVSAERPSVRVRARVVAFRPRESVPPERFSSAVDRWLGGLGEDGAMWRAERVAEARDRLPQPAAAGLRAVSPQRVTLDNGGDYLALAAAPGRENIDIYVMIRADDGDRLAAMDASPDCYPAAAFSTEIPAAAVVRVAGDTPGTRFEFHLYRALRADN